MTITETMRYPADEWTAGLEAAEEWEFCPIDTQENTPGSPGRLGAWLIDELYGAKVAGKSHGRREEDCETVDELILRAAIGALMVERDVWFTASELRSAVESYDGETGDDWRVLAEQYAEETGTTLVFIGGEPTEDDYHKWYADNGIRDGLVCAPTDDGGTLYWFDKNKWTV